MNSIGTNTQTYTNVDIRKVIDNFAADFSMMAQSTGLLSRESVAEVVYDLKILAEYKYLVDVKLILKDKDSNKIRAAVYKPSESAIGWNSDRPGNNLWPRIPDGFFSVIATLTQAWWSKTDTDKETFIKDTGLYNSWAQTKEDISLYGLNSSAGQKYASGGYGWERMNYSK